MPPSPPTAPADRLAGIIDGLCRSVAAQSDRRRPGGPLAGPLIILIWSRLRRIADRFAALAARIGAGRLRRPATPRPRAAPQAARPKRPPPKRLLPHNFAWLLPLVQQAAAAAASQLRHLLADPEMAALIAATPQAGRILRPLCRMLGVRPPHGPPPAPGAPPETPDPQAAAPPAPAAATRAPPPRSRASPLLRPRRRLGVGVSPIRG